MLANLCERAEDWTFGSAWRMAVGTRQSRQLLAAWPIMRPRQWKSFVNGPQTEAEVQAIRHSVTRGTPYGGEGWASQSAARLLIFALSCSTSRYDNRECFGEAWIENNIASAYIGSTRVLRPL